MGYKIDRQAQALICRILAAGGNLKVAAEAVGCTDRAIYAAKDRDPEFEKQMLESISRSQYESLITLADRAKENGNLAYKRLRMLYPDDYARAADTVSVKQVRFFVDELVKGISAAVEDDAVMAKIDRCFSQAMRDLRDRKMPKRDSRQDDDIDDDFDDETDALDDDDAQPDKAAG